MLEYFIKLVLMVNVVNWTSKLLKVCNEMDIEVEHMAPEEHESAAEQSRTKNAPGVVLHCVTPHPAQVHKILVIDALMEVTTRQLNGFPAKDRISCEFSPSAVMGEQKLDHKKHLKFTCGEFVQAH